VERQAIEFTLSRVSCAADVVALFEAIKGRPATDRERKDIENEMRHDRR